MTHDEVVDLLSTAAAFDRRKVGEADVIAWHAAVGDLDFPDSQAAVVGHYSQTTDWLMPAHVRTRVKAIREVRIAKAIVPAPASELSDTPNKYQEAFQQDLKRIARGFALPRAITAGRAEPTEEYIAARGDDPHRELRVASITTGCPHCQAVPGDRCMGAADKPITTAPAHDARLVAAGLARWVEIRGHRTTELITPEESK